MGEPTLDSCICKGNRHENAKISWVQETLPSKRRRAKRRRGQKGCYRDKDGHLYKYCQNCGARFYPSMHHVRDQIYCKDTKSPSEVVVTIAPRNQLLKFLLAGGPAHILVKFIRERMDFPAKVIFARLHKRQNPFPRLTLFAGMMIPAMKSRRYSHRPHRPCTQ